MTVIKNNRRISKALWLAFYVGIGLLVVVGIVGFEALHGVRGSFHIEARWAGLALWTPLIFGLVIRNLRKYWRLLTFWMALAALLAIHLLAFVVILQRYPEWRPVWFMFVAIVESVFLSTILEMMFSSKAR